MRPLEFVLRERRFLALGFALTWGSSFGQTFFVSVFGGEIRGAFDLDHAEYGAAYSLATVLSGLIILQAGRMIDLLDLRLVTAIVGLGVAAAAGVMAIAPVLPVLILGFFMLRLFGQGLSSHTGMTAMARYYDRDRGTAMSVAGTGHAVGEAVLPALAVIAIAEWGWRGAWTWVGAVVALGLVPLMLGLLDGHGRRHAAWLATLEPSEADDTDDDDDAPVTRRQWTCRDVLRDPRFFMIMPLVMAPGFLITGVFFHQNHLVEERGWTEAWFAIGFTVFAAVQVPCGILAGPTVDRVGARRLLPSFALPIAAGLAVLATVEGRAAVPAFMACCGVTAGIAGPIVGAAWAEFYGVRHLGAIRAMITAALVIGTAGSPILMGWGIDADVSLSSMFTGGAVATVVATILAALATRRPEPEDPS